MGGEPADLLIREDWMGTGRKDHEEVRIKRGLIFPGEDKKKGV